VDLPAGGLDTEAMISVLFRTFRSARRASRLSPTRRVMYTTPQTHARKTLPPLPCGGRWRLRAAFSSLRAPTNCQRTCSITDV